MRATLAIVSLIPLLAACEAAAPLAVVAGGSVAVMGRTPVDVVASLVTGRDCSVVRLDRRQSYCAPTEQPPAAQPYCTRSLGSVDCWTVPPHAIPPYRGVADGPNTLNAAQEADRTAWGPGLAVVLTPAPAPPAPPPVVMVVAPPPPVPVEAAPVVRAEPIPNPPAPRPRPRRAPRPAAAPAQPNCPCIPGTATPAVAPAAAPGPAAAPAPAAAPPPAAPARQNP
ncbi:MAG TPA: hypothetical protein VGM87_02075 [Roseomonas sp.]|jgi:hypothetical protein